MASTSLADIIYNILLGFASFLLIPVMALRGKNVWLYLRGFHSEVQSKLKGRRVLWVQAVSVGEVSAVLPLLKSWREERPGWAIVLTTTTEGGQTAAKQLASNLVDVIGYFPLDFSFIVRRSLKQIQPEIFIMAELEIWPNFLRVAQSMGVWTGIVNGRISNRSFPKYQRIRPLLSTVWNRVNYVCAQTKTDADRFVALGLSPERVTVSGNVKFDIAYPQIDPTLIGHFRDSLGWNQGQLILTAASTHAGEEAIIIDAFIRLREDYNCRLVLAPRHPDRREEVTQLLDNVKLPYLLRSQSTTAPDQPVLLMDTFGELALAYAVADAVFVGGSLCPVGGHNILEAAAQRHTPIYGPYMQNFKEIGQLFMDEKAGIMVEDGDELVSAISSLWDDPELGKALGEKAFELIKMHRGATQKTMSFIPGKVDG
ncbi:MAG TPA: 3-deoxy-D-manno-octulosonic acid transferase [Bacillota bacterium]|nr:3-deoxy-D-manno-octulosonic acid transferase [Bacillota bacterium]